MKNKNTKNKLNDKQLSKTSGGMKMNDIKQKWENVKRKANEFYSQAETKLKGALSRTENYLNKASKKTNDYLGK